MNIFTKKIDIIFWKPLLLLGMIMLLFHFQTQAQTETRTFNTSGDFQVPHKVTQIEVRVWGAGGAGASSSSNNFRGGGGGGGAFVSSIINPASGTYNFVVGTGIVNSNGGDSWFGSNTTVLAKGGTAANGSTGGARGSATNSIGNIRFPGGSGGNGVTNGSNQVSGGGGSSAGINAEGVDATANSGGIAPAGGGSGADGRTNDNPGRVGSTPGGGGSGARGPNAGGAGGNGQVTIMWTCPPPALISGPEEQTFCIGGSISPVIYEVGGAFDVTVTGLPDGVSYTYNQGDVTISGTPTEAGTFNYTISPVGSCEGNSIQGTIRVTPNNAAGTITSNTFCRNSPLPSGVFQPTNGATGIGTTSGLPSGITASFNDNQIIFSGTPTQTGVFDYSIPLNGGCGTVNATGTITINEEVAIFDENLAGQTSCPGTPFNPISVGEGFELTYQWYSNTIASNSGGVAISGATSHTFTPSSTDQGTTFYYAEVSGACGSTISSPVSGAFVVDPGNSVTPPSSSPTLCVNTVLTPITHTTTVATGISNEGSPGANGLPPGVSASWTGNQITISGTPTAFGTYDYSIPLTGGCGTVAATGTITVNAEPEILDPILPAQGSCLNGEFSPLSVGLGTGLSYQWYSNSTASNSGGTLISGATSNSFTPPSNTIGQRYYYVVVTSSCGTSDVSSASGLQEVFALPTPTFVQQPAAANCVDADITYSTQSGMTNYQWNLPGIAGTDYTIVSGGGTNDDNLTVRWITSGNKSVSINYTDGNGCRAVNPTASNSVQARRNTFTPTSPAIPSVCVNTELSPVSIGTTLATGIGTPTGLPPGVTATFGSNAITLSGTPTQPGTYNYTIPLTGGCGTVSASGTMVVTPVYELTSTTSVSPSAPGGSATVTIRGNTSSLPNGTYTITYSLGLANSGGPFTATVNVQNGRGTFTTGPINDPDLTSLTIHTIRRPSDSCTIDLNDRNITFFGTCAAVFDANGEFFVPAGITEITIKVWGGGGGGGGNQNNNNGAGGGGGGYSTVNIPVSPGNALNVVIGAGGNGQTSSGTPAQNGNASYVTRNPGSTDPQNTSIIYAPGGNGANGITPGSGGQGSSANGQNGQNPQASAGGRGGNGGGPNSGAGGNGGTGSGNNVGLPGNAPGGGGGGADGNANGGRGGSGLVIISYSCPPIDPDGCFTVIDDGSRSGATIIEFTCDSNWIAPEGLLDFEVVVIGAGGGGGMGNAAGGGGAGGFATGNVSTVSDTGMPDGTTFGIIVGQGGRGSSSTSNKGENGGSSSITGTLDGNSINISTSGGGGGGSSGAVIAANGSNGASGGGAAVNRPNPPSTNNNYEGNGGENNSSNGNRGGKGTIQIFENDPNKGAAAGGGGGGRVGLGNNGAAAGSGNAFGGNGGDGISYDLFGNIINYGGGGGGNGFNFEGNSQQQAPGNGGRVQGNAAIQLGGNGSVSGSGQNAPGIGSGGGAGSQGGGNGGSGRVFIIYSNVRILPVEFLYFQADYNSNKREAILNWATAKEWENSHFEVERSISGIKGFEKVGEVEGMGWTDQVTEYQYIDQQLPLGSHNVLYRLKQVDFSGEFQYSDVVSLRLPGVTFTHGVWRAYPNPTNGTALRIALMDRSQYDAEKLTFRIVHPMYVTAPTTVESEDKMNELLSNLALRVPKGVFVVEIQWGQKVEHIKILKQH